MAYIGTITHYKMLTPNVLEFILEVPQVLPNGAGPLPFVPGQWVLLDFSEGGEILKRAYSIVDYEVRDEKMYITLCVKLLDEGKGSTNLKNKKVGDTITFGGIFGRFQLQNTDVPKVFIGTGTGIAPVYNMAKTSTAKDKTLFFSVPRKDDLFYEEQIKNIPHLKYEIHITREEVPGYRFGRFDLSKFTFAPETEFYICGNPEMVKAVTEILKKLGFEKIYSEQY